MQHYQLFINGQWLDAQSGETITSYNPATDQPWASVASAGEYEVNQAVAAAKAAFLTGPWAQMTATQRGHLLYRLADLVAENTHRLGAIETTDSGKLAKETRAQTGYVADYYRYYAGLADKIQGHTLPIDKPDMHVFTTREPLGVVAAIVPWNAQMFLSATKLGPALAAGNTVVLKASEAAPATMFEFAKLVEQAGFPDGVINVITGNGVSCGAPLTSHPDVARVAFTGGPEVAGHVIANTRHNFAPVSLELGGKSPILVFEDADIDGAVNGLIAGNFGASGQSCVAGSRVILQRSLRDQIIEKLIARVGQIELGDPLLESTQMGPLATKAQVAKIQRVLSESKQQGAEIICGGEQPENLLPGYFMQPTIVDCADQQVASVANELFGPIMSVLTFDDEEEGIAMANNSQYGLGSGVFTSNVARALRVSKAIQSGIVWVNTYRAISPIAPFGGVKQSGYGREAGTDAILDYTRTKTTWINISDQPMANPFIMR